MFGANLAGHLAAYGFVAGWLGGRLALDPWTVAFGVLLIWTSAVDFERQEIPDTASALILLSGATVVVKDGPIDFDRLAGLALWPPLLWGVAAIYARLRGFHGLGFGDVKLIAGIGLWLGFSATTLVLLAAALAGILTLLAFAALRRVPLSEIGTSVIAFGPFLCLSAWAVWLQGGGQ